MNQEIKAKWIYALLSGEYQQGQQFLKLHGKFCCLGVLCDIHSKETGNEWVEHCYFKYGSSLPEIVMSWSGLEQNIPIVNEKSLAELNDSGSTFLEIANLIEKKL
jgi:hypothetical protein